MMRSLVRLLSLMRKEFRQFFRNVALVFIVIYAATLDPYAAGELTLDLKHFPIAIVDLDRSSSSAELADKLRPPFFRVVRQLSDTGPIEQMMIEGEVSMVMLIPEGFERRLEQRQQTEVQLILDGTNANSSTIAISYVAGIAAEFSESILLERWKLSRDSLDRFPYVRDQTRVLFNPNLDDSWFMVVSEFLTAITMISILLPAALTVYEKQFGTMEQLMVTPLRVHEIMLSKILTTALIILAATYLGIFTIVMGAKGIPIRGSLLYFALVTLIFLFTTSGLGLLISTVANNLAETILLTFIVLVPIIFLSGAWTPPEAMPLWMSQLILFSPLNYYLEIAYGIIFRGVGLAETWGSLLSLLGLGLLIFVAGAMRFRRKFA
jgi:ABC-2 type transport system permease protein